MEFIASSRERRRVWFVSFASRKDGEDIEEKSCMSFAHDAGLKPSRYGAMLLMTATSAGYIAVSFPWLPVIKL